MPNPKSRWFIPVSFWECYSFSSYIWFFNPFWVNFCRWCKLRIQLHSLACGCPVVSTPFVEKTIHSPSEQSWYPCQKSVNQRCIGLFLDSQLYSIDLYFYFYASATQSWLWLFCSNFWSQKYESSHFFLLFQDCFSYSGPLDTPCEF